MARNGDLPRWLGAVQPRNRVPHHAEIAVGIIVAGIAALADVRTAIGFSSFCVLVYYAIANVSALTLPLSRPDGLVAIVGLAGCLTLAFALPLTSVGEGLAVLAFGAVIYMLRPSMLAGSAPLVRRARARKTT